MNFEPKLALEWTLRLIIGGVFLAAGVLKAWNPALFFTDVENFRVVTGGAAAAVAFYLPWLEIILAAAVLGRWQYRGGVILAMGLSALFFVLLGTAWARGLDISCGCFGTTDKAANYPLLMLRAAGLFAGAGMLLYLDRLRRLKTR